MSEMANGGRRYRGSGMMVEFVSLGLRAAVTCKFRPSSQGPMAGRAKKIEASPFAAEMTKRMIEPRYQIDKVVSPSMEEQTTKRLKWSMKKRKLLVFRFPSVLVKAEADLVPLAGRFAQECCNTCSEPSWNGRPQATLHNMV
jgi:hypothetical protein